MPCLGSIAGIFNYAAQIQVRNGNDLLHIIRSQSNVIHSLHHGIPLKFIKNNVPGKSPEFLYCLRLYRSPSWDRRPCRSSEAAVRKPFGRGKPVSILRPTDGPYQGPVLVRRWIYPAVQTVIQREISMAQDRSRTAVTGSPELPLAHGRASDRAENGYPQRKTKGSILTKMF